QVNPGPSGRNKHDRSAGYADSHINSCSTGPTASAHHRPGPGDGGPKANSHTEPDTEPAANNNSLRSSHSDAHG
ncbi:MAG: hypothetical protein V3S68_06740, partial [Dehalococcoidia bacterium]